MATHSKDTAANGQRPPPADAAAPSFSIAHDGKIAGIYLPLDQRRKWTSADDARLELAARPARAEAAPEPVRTRSGVSRAKLIVALAVIGAALVLPFAGRWVFAAWKDRQARSARASGLIVIDSVPSNARLFIDGVEVGRTPYIAPNTFATGTTVPARILYPGAQEWTGTFQGGVPASFTAELQAQ